MATPGKTSNDGRARRFTGACGALSRYVREAAEKTVVEAVKTEVAASLARTIVALPLMPGADVSPATRMQEQQQKMMTVVYDARVLVLHDVPADRAFQLLRLAVAATNKVEGPGTRQNDGRLPVAPAVAAADMPTARKASLQRFMEKRKERVAAARAAPYVRGREPDRGSCTDNLSLTL